MTNFRKWFKGEYPGGHTSGYYFAHKAWQYRQQEIDQLKAQLNNMETCYIEKKKEVEDQQKRIDKYKKLTTSIRNEFDLWSDDSEFADLIEAQIENLEALRGEL